MIIGKQNITRSGKNRKFEILGRPQGKARPRFRRAGKFVSTYTPQKTVDYEKLIKQSFLLQCGKKKIDKGANIQVKITAHFKPNKSDPKKKAKYWVEHKVGFNKKPDCDNIAKVILDALNDVAFNDDNNIIELEVVKFYDVEDKVEVEINQIKEERV